MRHEQGHVDDHGAEQVGDDVAEEDAGGRDAERARRLDIFLALDGEGLAADDARHVEPEDRAHGEEHEHEVAAKEDDQHDDEKMKGRE